MERRQNHTINKFNHGIFLKISYIETNIRLSQISLEERQGIFTETCPDFLKLFREVLRRHNDFGGRATISAIPQAATITILVNQQMPSLKIKTIAEQEDLLYKSVRLFSKNEYLDSITITRKFAENVNSLMECFNKISGGQCFQTSPGIKQTFYHKNSKNDTASFSKSKHSTQIINSYDNFPPWFNSGVGGTIYEWLCAFYEQIIMAK